MSDEELEPEKDFDDEEGSEDEMPEKLSDEETEVGDKESVVEEEISEQELRSEKLETAKPRSLSDIETPCVLTKEEAGQCLCLLGKTANGLEYAYLMLKANNKKLTDISVVPSFPHVLFVDVCGNRLTEENLEVLTFMKFLLMIKADENRLTTPRISTMPYLQVLSLNKNDIRTTEGIHHPLLECLELNNNQVREVVGLEPSVLRRLKVLELRGNSLFTTAGIRLETLERLYLAENLIENLDDLGSLVNLRILHLRDNPLSNLNGFSNKMTSLSYLNLRKCRIEEMNELKKLSVLPKLDTIIVSENPFTEETEEDYRIELLTYMPKLKRLDKGLIQDFEIEEAEQIREDRDAEELGGEEDEIEED